MLKKINRGLSRKDFEESLKSGKLYQSPLFAVSIIQNKEEEGGCNPPVHLPKFGFIVSKKISKLAVERNRIRRLLAEATKKNMVDCGNKGDKVIFLARRAMIGKKMEEVEKEVKLVFEKMKGRP